MFLLLYFVNFFLLLWVSLAFWLFYNICGKCTRSPPAKGEISLDELVFIARLKAYGTKWILDKYYFLNGSKKLNDHDYFVGLLAASVNAEWAEETTPKGFLKTTNISKKWTYYFHIIQLCNVLTMYIGRGEEIKVNAYIIHSFIPRA